MTIKAAQARVFHADCLDAMREMEADSIDAIVTDPPYGLAFMGKGWDHGVPGVEFWREALRVAKPGAHLVAFGGTRTYHRLACAIEDAGWEIRDCLSWLYGSGFPKSLDVSKAIDKAAGAVRGEEQPHPTNQCKGGQWCKCQTLDATGRYSPTKHPAITAPATDAARAWQGWGTALKPAWEPIILARKPLVGTVASNVLAHGTGAINVDACRIGYESDADLAETKKKNPGRSDLVTATVYGANRPQQTVNAEGRWPANVALDEEAAAMLDAQTGTLKSGKLLPTHRLKASENHSMSGPNQERSPRQEFGGDSGGASRFFFVAQRRTVDEWTPDPASAADSDSSPQSRPDASVPDDAATSDSREETPSSGSKERTTNATPTGSKPSDENSTPTTLHSEVVSSRASRHESTSPHAPASGAEQSAPTGTTTTTSSHSSSDSSVAPVTSLSTLSSAGPGEADFVRFRYTAKASRRERGEANTHPTVKPIALMRWLVRLVTPKGGVVLDPFCGSGTTLVAAVEEGFDAVGIEREAEYVEIIKKRIS